MAQTIEIFAYTGSDTKEYLKAWTKSPDGVSVPVNWSSYDEITIILRQEATAGAIGLHVTTVSTLTHPTLFQIVGQTSEVLVFNTSKVPNVEPFKRYESLIKVHDLDHPDGQVICDFKSNNSLPTLLIRVYPGDAS